MKPVNPFVPQGSILEQHKRRSRLKLAVLCAVAISVAGLSAMLIQGCKREQNAETSNAETNAGTNAFFEADTNVPPPMGAPESTNAAAVAPTNPVEETPSIPAAITPPPAASEAPATTEYVVVQGDTLGKIAKAHGVSLRALESANPDVRPTRLKIGQKLEIPAASGGAATSASEGTGGEQVYTVKAGDTLTKIARRHGVTIRAIREANNLSTTRILVGQKLKIPAPVESAATNVSAPPAPAPAPAPASAPAGPDNAPAGP
ncbi:MAG: LysM peptidoglycan-binding domain-containing protein [Verrucomicrobia bacterium]|nr:LysM peptidoglycan-binding domain-containing protein [Verrucomicrobiota bacterium]MDE3099364.1 LysM peptidoglycan-binding domain-containing protein [Verrucomicrobiota bacterium]